MWLGFLLETLPIVSDSFYFKVNQKLNELIEAGYIGVTGLHVLD